MFAPTAMMVLAVFSGYTVNPTDSLNEPQTIQEDQGRQEQFARPASPQQQTTWDGILEDRNDADQVETGLYNDPEADGYVILPWE